MLGGIKWDYGGLNGRFWGCSRRGCGVTGGLNSAVGGGGGRKWGLWGVWGAIMGVVGVLEGSGGLIGVLGCLPPQLCLPTGTSSQLGAGGGRATPPLVSLYPALECRAIMQQMSPTAFGEGGTLGGYLGSFGGGGSFILGIKGGRGVIHLWILAL